ncbi:RBP11-like subunits of RNA polymerase [Mytilinidion resinicola]|uniref:DNA-directed RNA polymerases I and III subunit RPAC2 n=1 Tax=Mytilinidion resinicola TaxID=574789 RepID=A0A6A6YRL3_9PEZI|nr:RBP11-like subunits of RNA polymerase [Mytilinidion resinicola]KAF2811411.1 RBP11-like subunits of RNA polymerase [Mytilinidion resinicola]
MPSATRDTDATMVDAPAEEGAVESPAPEEAEEQRIRVLSGSTEEAASFEFENEDHTLGNALRYIIMKNPDVEFCGYSIPHPSEAKMHLRIQTYDKVSVYDVLEKGLNDLSDLCEVVMDKFTIARDEFNAKKASTT